MPHVHPRLRKCSPRCTLDCGFQTPESPALRGFEAERGPITGTSLYLVLKSNGPHRSKNLPVKFGFSSKIVPTNIAKKLPPQRCFKPLFIAFFNFSHKWPTFAFTPESGYTLGFRRKIAHKRLHAETGAFPPPATMRLCAASEIALLYHSIPPCFSTSCTNGPRSLSQTKAGTRSPLPTGSHTTAYTVKQGSFRMGVVSLPSERSARFGNPAWPGGRTANFAAFGPWSGVLSKNTESLRNSDALMRVAVPKASRPRWAA